MTVGRPADAAELAAASRAVQLAASGAGTVLPNPVVGCVVLAPDGSVLGEGSHEQAGGPHAEIFALRAAGARAKGATAVVTLEPCNHTGRTGPCAAALVEAGIARAIVAVRDPWPPAAGGIEVLRNAGVDVVDLTAASDPDALAIVAAAEDVNRVWLAATRNRRPFVTWKVGMTLDGRVAAADGTSRWISSARSRADSHLLRTQVDTMMVGIGTVLADDPALTARDAQERPYDHQPLRVVVDSTGRTPPDAHVLDSTADTLIATAAEFGGADGRVDLGRLLSALYERGRRHVLLEGGPTLAATAFDRGLVDEVLVYLAPLLLGAGRSALDGGAVETLAQAHRLELRETALVGPDVRLRYRVLS